MSLPNWIMELPNGPIRAKAFAKLADAQTIRENAKQRFKDETALIEGRRDRALKQAEGIVTEARRAAQDLIASAKADATGSR